MGTLVIRVPEDLLKLLKEDDIDDPPGPVLQKSYEEYRRLRALAQVLRERGFKDGKTTFEIIKNYVARSDGTILELQSELEGARKDLEGERDKREWYEDHFVSLMEMLEKADFLGVRTTLPAVVTRVKAHRAKP